MREQRLQIMLTELEVQAIDDWRFAKRMPTRAAAVRELLKRGIAVDGFDTAAFGDKSENFGVISNRNASSHSRRSDG